MENSAKIFPLHTDIVESPKTPSKKTIQSELRALNRKKQIKLRAKKLKNNTYSLYLHFRRDNYQEYQFLKLYILNKQHSVKNDKESLKLALSIRDKKELELFQNDYDFHLYNQNSKANFIEYFESVVQTKIKSDGTIDKSWKHTLKHLKIFTKNKPINFRQVDEKFSEKFRDYLKDNLSPNTAHVYFAKLKAAFNQAIKDKIILTNPAQFLHISKQETYREFLTLEEIKILKDTPCKSEQTKNAFLFSCFTGLRISDIKKLSWNEIQGNYLVFRQKKTAGMERLKLSVNALQIIDEQMAGGNSKKVFNLISENKAILQIKDWVKTAGINKNISWHNGRHTFATLAITFNDDIYTVSKLLGHRDVKVTQIYAKLVDKKKDEAIDNIPVI